MMRKLRKANNQKGGDGVQTSSVVGFSYYTTVDIKLKLSDQRKRTSILSSS